MAFWMWLVLGIAVGAAPALAAAPRFRPWWARRWWRLSFGIVFVCLILPFGIVLILFLSDAAYDAIHEMWLLWSGDFSWLSALVLGWLVSSAAMAWRHRHGPRLQGPPPSDRVAALAGDPAQQWQAIQQYRKETGVAFPVASDVVEGFVAGPRTGAQAAPPRPAAGAVEWMYGGFATAWYAALATGFAFSLSTPGNHFLTGLALFVFIPSLFAGICGVCAGVVSAGTKARLLEGLERGLLTRRYAFGAGMAAGAVSMAGTVVVVAALYPWRHTEASVLLALFGVVAVLGLSPFLGLWLLKRSAPHGHD